MRNSITIVGHVGQKPVAKFFPKTRTNLATFSVAVKEYDATAENKERTLWFDVQAWNGMHERVMKTITKGREVVINGRVGIDLYTRQDGTVVEKYVINLTSFHLCGRKPAPEVAETVEQPVLVSTGY